MERCRKTHQLEKRVQGEESSVSHRRISSISCGRFTNTNIAARYKCIAGERDNLEATVQFRSHFQSRLKELSASGRYSGRVCSQEQGVPGRSASLEKVFWGTASI
jgi:hypothetical protein